MSSRLWFCSFIRCLRRHENSCARVDTFYTPPAGTWMAKRREGVVQRKPLPQQVIPTD